jgi:hypothetical protein
MKKVFFVATFVVASFIGANAQFQFGAGVVAGLPIGDFDAVSSFVVGGELQGEYKFSEKASGVATISYNHFLGKDLGGGIKVSFGAVPILVGARVYPSEQFFIGAQVGYGFTTGDLSGSGFAYKPQIGYNAGSFQLAASYNAISDNGTLSWIGLSGIFKFGGSGASSK